MIINRNELGVIRAENENATVAFRLGCYDLLHAGHQEGIDYAAAQADLLVVGVMPDEYVSRVKGPFRPINSETVRLAKIDAVEAVDYSLIVEPSALGIAGLFRALKPDVYIEDYEHRSGAAKRLYLKDPQSKVASTTEMITRFGLDQAMTLSSMTYRSV